MEFINANEIISLSNPGVVSRQLLNPDNSSSKRVTITEVHLEPVSMEALARVSTCLECGLDDIVEITKGDK